MVFSLSVLQHYAMSSVNRVCHLFRSATIYNELCVRPVYSRTDQSYQIQSETPMVQQGSQLSKWTEYLRTPQCFGNGRRVYNYLSGQKV